MTLVNIHRRFIRLSIAPTILLLVLIITVTTLTNPHPPSFWLRSHAKRLQAHPIPTPEFIDAPTSLRSGANFCVDFDQFVIFEPGDEGDTYDSIRDTTTLTIDGKRIDDLIIGQLLTSIARDDENGAYIGSHGGDAGFCHRVEGLQPGIHTAMIRLNSSAGKLYIHAWAFEVPE